MGRKAMAEIRRKLREVVTEDYRKFIKYYLADVKRIQELRERRLVVVSGDDPIKVGGVTADVVLKFVKKLKKMGLLKGPVPVLHVFHDEFPDARQRAKILSNVLGKNPDVDLTQAVYEVSKKFLGSTFKVLIMDLVNDLKPNDVGRLMGIVEGGGIVIYMAPSLERWPRLKTIFRQNLAVPNHPEPRYVFISYFIRKLMEHKGIYIFDTDNGRLVKTGFLKMKKRRRAREKLKLPKDVLFPKEIYKVALTQDQVNVIKLIEDHLVPKPGKKRVAIVITADRGRGKSSAVGIGIVGLINELMRIKNKVRVAVTASAPLSVQAFMELAKKTLDVVGLKYREITREGQVLELKGDRFSIEYWEPYTVLRLNVDVVVVDEAAGIPVPLLHKIWRKYKRTIYATTIHGYEGAGRGFSIRFLKRLQEDKKTKLVLYEMMEPIRYSADDPIEKFQFDVLLLDAEPDPLDKEDLKEIEEGNFEYVKYDPEYLFSKEGEKELRSLFGIYVLAHYRNEPDDLGRIADAPHHSVRAVKLKKSGKIVAAVQLAEEGGLTDDIIDELLMGGKIPGNIIPDRLLKHLRLRDFGKGVGWRIVRIAVHSDVQGKGIGTYALRKVVEEAKRRGYDWVGAGFGVSKELMNFWIKNGFYPLHMSPDRNPVSGEYTSLVVKPLSEKWEELVVRGIKEFSVKLVESLHSVYNDFEPDTIYLLFKKCLRNKEYASKITISDVQASRLQAYVEGIMTFESVGDVMTLLVKKALLMGWISEIGELEASVVIARALQGRDWAYIYEELRVGKVKAVTILRKVAERLGIRARIINPKPEERESEESPDRVLPPEEEGVGSTDNNNNNYGGEE